MGSRRELQIIEGHQLDLRNILYIPRGHAAPSLKVRSYEQCRQGREAPGRKFVSGGTSGIEDLQRSANDVRRILDYGSWDVTVTRYCRLCTL